MSGESTKKASASVVEDTLGLADLYDRVRSRYPEQLFNDLMAVGRLTPAIAVLEIGCGTGKASVPLARRVTHLVCLEPDETLAVRARYNLREFSSAEVIVSAFEMWESTEPFDVVFAGSAWHRLDPRTRYTRVSGTLKQRGQLAVVTTSHVYPEGFDPLFAQVQELYDKAGESPSTDWPHISQPKPEEIPDARGEIEESKLFDDIRIKRYPWSARYSALEFIDLLDTYPANRSMDPSKRSALYAEIKRLINQDPNGTIRMQYVTVLNLARVI